MLQESCQLPQAQQGGANKLGETPAAARRAGHCREKILRCGKDFPYGPGDFARIAGNCVLTAGADPAEPTST